MRMQPYFHGYPTNNNENIVIDKLFGYPGKIATSMCKKRVIQIYECDKLKWPAVINSKQGAD